MQAASADFVKVVESRHGFLYCQICADFVYDPELEKIRTQRGTRRQCLQIDR